MCWTGLRYLSSRACRRRPPPSLPAGGICTRLTGLYMRLEPTPGVDRSSPASAPVRPSVPAGRRPIAPSRPPVVWCSKTRLPGTCNPAPEDMVTRDIAQPGVANACSRLSGPLLRSAARARRGLFSVGTNRHRTILPKSRTSTPPVSYSYATYARRRRPARVAWPTGLGPTVGAEQRTKRRLRSWPIGTLTERPERPV